MPLPVHFLQRAYGKKYNQAQYHPVSGQQPDEAAEQGKGGENHNDDIVVTEAELHSEGELLHKQHHYKQDKANQIHSPALEFRAVLNSHERNEHSEPYCDSGGNLRQGDLACNQARIAQHQTEGGQSQPAFHNTQRHLAERGALGEFASQRERHRGSHREDEEWEYQIHPGDAFDVRIEYEGRRAHLTVEHKGRQTGIPDERSAEHHHKDGKPAEHVYGEYSFVHYFLRFFQYCSISSRVLPVVSGILKRMMYI